MSLKYNRTFHFPWSKGATNDDKIAKDLSYLINSDIIITEKMDGSNSSLELNGCFARTHADTPTHSSFDHLKAFHSTIKYKLKPNIQLFGENLFAKHSISYNELSNYFMLFGVRELKEGEDHIWESWDTVKEWANELEIPTVPELYVGKISSEKELKKIVEFLMIQPSCCGGIREGVVVRVRSSFIDGAFSKCVLKCVRENHVNTDDHWAHQTIIKNKLKPT